MTAASESPASSLHAGGAVDSRHADVRTNESERGERDCSPWRAPGERHLFGDAAEARSEGLIPGTPPFGPESRGQVYRLWRRVTENRKNRRPPPRQE
ncbi:hypothetical protein HPB47_021364 [Ixodes persulcatus]|uniref:Uncharacterized protein n=1 Tax=Ixodes persulcatus TaxID=34615 RepID=A0AC60QDR9_IXOPE|nr:hypothetical protein HPB47_021364 [Ixodes persulcatus]